MPAVASTMRIATTWPSRRIPRVPRVFGNAQQDGEKNAAEQDRLATGIVDGDPGPASAHRRPSISSDIPSATARHTPLPPAGRAPSSPKTHDRPLAPHH